MVPSLYLKPFSRYLDLNTECSQTDGQKEKSITIYLAVHSVHLADIIIPVGNEATRHAELVNIQAWTERNNLRLNFNKSCEVIFADRRCRGQRAAEPSSMPGIRCSASLKMLGVDITSDSISRLVTASAQTIYALHVLRSRGLNNAALHQVYRAIVVAQLMYAASAWRGFMKASDHQRIDSAIDRARRYGTVHRILNYVTLRTMSCSIRL